MKHLVTILVTVTAVVFTSTIYSAEISNVRAEQALFSNAVVVRYDLIDERCGNWRVRLRAYDGEQELTLDHCNVTGDVGEGVSSGKDKRLVWLAAKDHQRLRGKHFSVEVVAERMPDERKEEGADERVVRHGRGGVLRGKVQPSVPPPGT